MTSLVTRIPCEQEYFFLREERIMNLISLISIEFSLPEVNSQKASKNFSFPLNLFVNTLYRIIETILRQVQLIHTL